MQKQFIQIGLLYLFLKLKKKKKQNKTETETRNEDHTKRSLSYCTWNNIRQILGLIPPLIICLLLIYEIQKLYPKSQ